MLDFLNLEIVIRNWIIPLSAINLPPSKKALRKKSTRLYVIGQRPTLPPFGSTIGAIGLNFSVRNGKRCAPTLLSPQSRYRTMIVCSVIRFDKI